MFWSDTDSDVRARAIFATELGPVYVPAFATYGSVDISSQNLGDNLPREMERCFARAAIFFAWMGLRLLSMLTARNSPLIVGVEEDFFALNKQRPAKGRHALLGSKPMRWYLSRIERRLSESGKSLTDAARSQAMSHLVRGHLKIRHSCVFWWSQHFRLTAGESQPTGRDDIVKSGAGSPQKRTWKSVISDS